MKIIENIAITHEIPVQISHRENNKEIKQFVNKRTVMSDIASKDREKMLVVRKQQAEELKKARRVGWEKLSEEKRAEIEKKWKPKKDGVIGEQAYAWWNKSEKERAIITEKQRATRKERFVKYGRLPEIKQRQGERYRATVAAKTEEERRALIEKQKISIAGRTEEEKLVSRKRRAETIAMKSKDEIAKSAKKMVDAKANKSEEEKLLQHLRTKAIWVKKSKEDIQKKIAKTIATIKNMSLEDKKASLVLIEVKKKATAVEKERRKSFGLPDLTQSEIRSCSWEKNLLQSK